MAEVFIALGSSLESREIYLDLAILELWTIGTPQKISHIYETEPLGSSERKYLNQVVQLKTKLDSAELLFKLKIIEKKLGRKKRGHWGDREIDLDILLYGDEVIWRPDLQIPHTELPHRRFVLAPLAELASDLVHPVLGFKIHELLQYTPTNLAVSKWRN